MTQRKREMNVVFDKSIKISGSRFDDSSSGYLRISAECSAISEPDSVSVQTKKTGSPKNKLDQARKTAGNIINADPIQYGIIALILVNAVMMGIATFDFIAKNEDAETAFEIVDQIFLIIFTIEAAIQIFYKGIETFNDSWLLFDIIVVVCSWSLSGVQVIRAVRVFRALRLVTRFKGMRKLIEALAKTLPSMAGISALLGLIIFIFSVMFTEFFREDSDYFLRLDTSFLTSFQIMTFDNWAEIVRGVMAKSEWGWIPLVSFVLITGFMVIHLVIAVICDAIGDLNDEEKEYFKIEKIFEEIYPDQDDEVENLDSTRNSENCDSNTPEKISTHDQVLMLENQMNDLMLANERTLYWLEQITEQVDSFTNINY